MYLKLLEAINLNQIYFYLAILFSFSLPLSWNLSKAALYAMVLSWLIQGNFKEQFKSIKDSKLVKILFLFALYQLLTLFWTDDLAGSSKLLRNMLIWLIIPIAAVNLKPKQVPTVITAFLFGMFISEVVAYGMIFEFWTIRGHGAEYPSPFMYHIQYSIFMAVTAIILLNRIYSNRYNLKEKTVMGLFFLTLNGNLFFSIGRTGQVAFAVAIIVAGILHFRLRIKSLLLSVFLILAIFYAAYTISPAFQKRLNLAINDVEKLESNKFNSSLGIRAAYILLGIEIIKDHPLLGVGIGDYKPAIKTYIDADRVEFSKGVENFMVKWHFHNQYIQTAVQSGLLGLLLLLLIFYYYLKMPIDNEELKRLSILFIVIVMVASITEPVFMVKYFNALFVLFTTLFVTASLDKKATSLHIDQNSK